MKRLFIPALSVAVMITATQSCSVNKDFDLSNIDTEMTILPGIKIPINQDLTKLDVEDLLSLGDALGIATGSDGVFSFAAAPASSEASTSASSFDAGTEVSLPDLEISLGSIPDFIKASDIKFANPAVKFLVSNPSSVEAILTATIKDKTGKSVPFSCTVPASSSSYEAVCTTAAALFSPIPEALTVSDLKIRAKSAAPASSNGIKLTDATPYRFVVNCGTDLPFVFEPGTKVNVDYTFDLDSYGLDLDDFDLKATAITVEGTAISSLPVSLSVRADAVEVPASIELKPGINGGTIESPATTNFTIEVKASGNIMDIKKINLKCSAEIIGNEPVTIKKNQGIDLSIKSFALNDGIGIKF